MSGNENQNKDHLITVVSGLPRSGTSMLMAMLQAGGLPIFYDNRRRSDADNPRGYYEAERVKDMARDASWLPLAQGHAVKIISFLLRCLPGALSYRIIFMERNLSEIISSQRQMLAGNGGVDNLDERLLAARFAIHLRKIKRYLSARNIPVLYCRYDEVITDPFQQAVRLDNFLGGGLNYESMAMVVDPELYRQRG